MNATDDTNAACRGSGSNDLLGLEPERAAFARWCRDNGHGELDDMLTPLDRSLRALMWPVWQGAVASERERHTRKPLTHMQIVMLWGHRSDGPSTPELVSFSRLLERHHGIGA